MAIKFNRPGQTSDCLMRGCNSTCEAQMSRSISKLADVSRKRLPISTVLLTSLLLLNSLCFLGRIPDTLDSGLTEKCGQLRSSGDVAPCASCARALPPRSQREPESPPPPGRAEEPSPPPHCLYSCIIRGAWDLGARAADCVHE